MRGAVLEGGVVPVHPSPAHPGQHVLLPGWICCNGVTLDRQHPHHGGSPQPDHNARCDDEALHPDHGLLEVHSDVSGVEDDRLDQREIMVIGDKLVVATVAAIFFVMKLATIKLSMDEMLRSAIWLAICW